MGLPVARSLPPSPDLLQAADPGIPKGGPAASGAGCVAGSGPRELGAFAAPSALRLLLKHRQQNEVATGLAAKQHI